MDQRVSISTKEISSPANRQAFLDAVESLGIPISQAGVPLIVVTEPDGNAYALIGDEEVVSHFKPFEEEIKKQN